MHSLSKYIALCVFAGDLYRCIGAVGPITIMKCEHIETLIHSAAMEYNMTNL